MLYKKVFYEDREIENGRLELADKGSLYFLGSNVTFRDCTLVLDVSSRNLIFEQGTWFINCTFEPNTRSPLQSSWIPPLEELRAVIEKFDCIIY